MSTWTLAVQVLGWAGVLLYVIAYGMVSAGRTTGQSPSYQTLNLVGAFGVAANAFYYGAYPSAVVNVIWFAIAAITLLGVMRAGRVGDPARPHSREGRAFLGTLGFVGGILALLGIGLAFIALMPRPERPIQPVLVFTQDWPPYVGRDLPDGGPLSQLVTDLLRATNYEARILFTDWEDVLGKVETGVGAVGYPFIEGRAREERVLFTDPVLDFEYVLFYRRGLLAPAGERDEEAVRAWLDHLEAGDAWEGGRWRLGTVAGYQIWPELAELASVDVDFDTPAEAFRALARGEIEFLAEGRLVGLRTIRDPAAGIDASTILAFGGGDPRAASEEPLRLVTGRGAAGRQLQAELNERIAEFRERGELAELHARFEAFGRTEIALEMVTEALRPPPEGTVHLLPAGTRAHVLRWPPGFGPREETGGMGGPENGRARVRILNGPLEGWELLVDPAAFRIVDRGGAP